MMRDGISSCVRMGGGSSLRTGRRVRPEIVEKMGVGSKGGPTAILPVVPGEETRPSVDSLSRDRVPDLTVPVPTRL